MWVVGGYGGDNGQDSHSEMKRYNYDDTLATGSVASAGTLGVMIPPSTVFLIYGILTEQSIGKLFIAGVLPGILLAFLMMITVVFFAGAILTSLPLELEPVGKGG